MRQRENRTGNSYPAAGLLAIALVLTGSAGAGPAAMAQDALPSVSDYRLPSGNSSPSPAPRVRAPGPVDPDNPTATPSARRADPTPAETPAPASSAAPRTAAAASPVAAASGRPANAAPAHSGQPGTAVFASHPLQPAATPVANSPAPAMPSNAAPSPPAEASAAPLPFEWRVHSAKEAAGSMYSGNELWLTVLAFVLGAGLMLLGQLAWRRRKARAAEAMDWDEVQTGAELAELDEPAAPAVQAVMPEALRSPPPELDLVTILDEPAGPAPQAPAPSPIAAAGPLDIALSARRMSATLMNTVLHYELTVSNGGKDAIGPVLVGGDMIAAHASLPDRAQLELGNSEIAALHKLAAIPPGESVTVSGEFKLPLASITPIRSGNAALFIPLARFRVEAARAGIPALVLARTFVVGEDPELPGAALKPFRLDLGPRLYSNIGQRELAQAV